MSISRNYSINCKGQLLDLSCPIVMGILNVTPDSFYDGGWYNQKERISIRVREMLNEGTNIIDVGGYSSRPGAKNISVQEEIDRVLPVIELISKNHSEAVVSIDTFRSEVARIALDAGACIVNDISAGNLDEEMFTLVRSYQVPYIIMHMQNNPQTMQNEPQYEEVVTEVFKSLAEKVNHLKALGVNDIVVDPGFGFGKTITHNYKLLNHLNRFTYLDLPLLVGFSRKSMIYKSLGTTPEHVLNGTTVLNTLALTKGANILRVHDVKAAKEAVKLFSLTQQNAE